MNQQNLHTSSIAKVTNGTLPSTFAVQGARFGSKARKGSKGGFSLVEVVLAIGVVAVAFVSILGLLPVGLTTFRQTVDNTVGSQIVQRVINEAQQTDFPTLTSSNAAVRYFDDQGTEVAATGAYIYTVKVTVSGTTSLPNTNTSASLATVTVQIANNPGHNPSPFDSPSIIPYSSYTALIAKNTN